MSNKKQTQLEARVQRLAAVKAQKLRLLYALNDVLSDANARVLEDDSTLVYTRALLPNGKLVVVVYDDTGGWDMFGQLTQSNSIKDTEKALQKYAKYSTARGDL